MVTLAGTAPEELSFQDWTPQDPLPDFDGDVSSFVLEPPESSQDGEVWLAGHMSDPSFPVHVPDHPYFGKALSVSVPVRALPGQAPPLFSNSSESLASVFPHHDDSPSTDQSPGVIAENDDISHFPEEKMVENDQSGANDCDTFGNSLIPPTLDVDDRSCSVSCGISADLPSVDQSDLTVGVKNVSSVAEHHPSRRPVNQRWFYVLRAPRRHS